MINFVGGGVTLNIQSGGGGRREWQEGVKDVFTSLHAKFPMLLQKMLKFLHCSAHAKGSGDML